MPDLLIRNVPSEEVDEIRAAAAARGISLQRYLRDAMRAQAVYLRRQTALAKAAERLADRVPVLDKERAAVLDAVEQATDERADQLSARPES